jgi:hypothetical protein
MGRAVRTLPAANTGRVFDGVPARRALAAATGISVE